MPASGGRTVSRKALKGKPFVLYFYPKADTPGCTKEACAFQEALPQLAGIGIDVIGVSPDKMKPIERFAEKYQAEHSRLHRMNCTRWPRSTAPGSRSRCMDGSIWAWSAAHS